MESLPECLEVVDSFQIVKDASLEQKLGQVADEHETLPQHLKRLFLYCSLFPFGYEFSKDELVQLWIAEGFIRKRQRERMEDTAGEHFNSLENEGFFVISRCDFTMDFDSLQSAPTDNSSNFLYKVNPSKHSLLDHTMFSGTYFKAVDGKLDGASEMTRHLSLIGEDMDGMDFGMLQNFKHLRTLHMLSCRGSSMKHVPRDLCFTLTFLRTLNLSGTLISELPSSIGNVKSLRHVDASHTPISRLPESMDSLHNLQTIKLRGCIHFVQLPKGTKKLKKLRHIDLDIIRQLDSMPPHLGNLSNLQTLPAFLVGRDDGCRVGELKNLNDLKGSFNISRLENVLSKEEAEEAALIEKKCIHRLELRWSDMFVDHAQQEKILECLQPHSGLKELQLQQYSGSILPTWIGNPSFTDLVVITLYRCRNCKLLPCMGQLPALKSLSIIEVNEVKEINHQFFRKGLADRAFPKLERLEVDMMLSLKQWKDVQVGDLPSLVKLTLDSCPELVTLPALFYLKSLKHLELRYCPKLMALPAGGLPTSLEFFLLLDCLELKIWCLKTEHWTMLCHVPSIWFDHEEIKDLQLTSGTTEVLPWSPQFSGDVHRIGKDDGSTAATEEKLQRTNIAKIVTERDFEYLQKSGCIQGIAEALNSNTSATEEELQHTNIAKIVMERDFESLQKYGCVQGIAEALNSDLQNGIPGNEEDVSSRRPVSALSTTQAPVQGFFKLLLQSSNNYTIFLLLVAALLSIVFGMKEEGPSTGWYDGAIIVFAIIILVVASSIRNFWLQNPQSHAMRQTAGATEMVVEVIRGGSSCEIPVCDVVSGDIVCLKRGSTVPSDGLFVSGEFVVLGDGTVATIYDKKPFLFCGSKVVGGSGRMLVTSGGMNTVAKVANTLDWAHLPAPLDKFSTGISILILVVLFSSFMVERENNHSGLPDLRGKPTASKEIMNLIEKIVMKPSGRISILTTSLAIFLVVVEVVTLAIRYRNKKALFGNVHGYRIGMDDGSTAATKGKLQLNTGIDLQRMREDLLFKVFCKLARNPRGKSRRCEFSVSN